MIRPVWLRSELELVFEPGVEVVAKKGEFKWMDDCLFNARDASGIAIRGGDGVVLRMHKADYQDQAQYAPGEWRMALSFLGCSDVHVEDLTILNSGGDGIYLGPSRQPFCRNVVIRGVKCLNHQRQGISIISAENVLIENCELSNTDGANPQAGIDLEPNVASERLKNIVIRNVIAADNTGPGFVTYLSPLDSSSEPVTVTFENCSATGNGLPGFLLAFPPTTSAGDTGITLIGCRSRDSAVEELRISDKPAEGSRLSLRDCSFSKSDPADRSAPIVFVSSPANTVDVGGAEFVNVAVTGDAPLAFRSKTDSIPLTGLSGAIRNDKGTTWDLAAYQLPPRFGDDTPHLGFTGDYVPARNAAVPPLPALAQQAVYCRSPANYAFCADAGEDVILEFDYRQVGDYPGVDFHARLCGPDGQSISVPVMPFEAKTPFAFTAPLRGVYRLRVGLWNNKLAVSRPRGGICILQHRAIATFMSPHGRLYLNVPAATRRFSIHLIPNGILEGDDVHETAGATLYRSDGSVQEKADAVEERRVLLVERQESDVDEVWALDLYPPSEGVFGNFGIEINGVPPLLATTPAGLLVSAGGD